MLEGKIYERLIENRGHSAERDNRFGLRHHRAAKTVSGLLLRLEHRENLINYDVYWSMEMEH